MFDPEVEARFKKIDDELLVAAEILRRFEMKTDERIGHLEAIQGAMARWQDRMAERQERADREMTELRSVVSELSRTVDRFLRARGDGGAN